VSCDDGEDSFHSRLTEELEKFGKGARVMEPQVLINALINAIEVEENIALKMLLMYCKEYIEENENVHKS